MPRRGRSPSTISAVLVAGDDVDATAQRIPDGVLGQVLEHLRVATRSLERADVPAPQEEDVPVLCARSREDGGEITGESIVEGNVAAGEGRQRMSE